MGYIYIIGYDNMFKVGYSANPQKRLKELQTGNSNHLTLFYTEEITTRKINVMESLIHKDLKFDKVKGEWFSCPLDKIIGIIQYYKITFDNDCTINPFLISY